MSGGLRRARLWTTGLLCALSAACTRGVPAPRSAGAQPPRRAAGDDASAATGETPYDKEPFADAPSESAPVSNRVVTLRAPLPARAELALLDDFFRAVAGENADRIAALSTADAAVTLGGYTGSTGLVEHWRARFRSLNYASLGASRPYDARGIERYGPGDPPAAGPRGHVELGEGERLLRVPMSITRAGTERLFADDLWFVLRRAGREYRVRAIFEEFTTP